MKRFALLLAASTVVGSSALAGAAVHAYQPVDDEYLEADPGVVAPGGTFDAVVSGCFPGAPGESGEEILFINIDAVPQQVEVGTCEPTFQARVTFQAPDEVGEYRIVAFLPAQDPDDLSGRPTRFLEAFYFVSDEIIDIDQSAGGGGPGGEVEIISTGGSSDNWPSFLSAAGFYRTFLALLALMAGVFFVWLWRRRREDERLGAVYRSPMRSPDPGNPSMA